MDAIEYMNIKTAQVHDRSFREEKRKKIYIYIFDNYGKATL